MTRGSRGRAAGVRQEGRGGADTPHPARFDPWGRNPTHQ
jgi:hypothetical protein